MNEPATKRLTGTVAAPKIVIFGNSPPFLFSYFYLSRHDPSVVDFVTVLARNKKPLVDYVAVPFAHVRIN